MENKKEKLKAIWVWLGIGLLVIIFISISSNKEDKRPIHTRVTPSIEDHLPESYKTEFMVSCLEEDSTQYDYCECAFNYLDKNYTNSDVVNMSLEVEKTGEVSNEMIDAVGACLDLYNY